MGKYASLTFYNINNNNSQNHALSNNPTINQHTPKQQQQPKPQLNDKLTYAQILKQKNQRNPIHK